MTNVEVSDKALKLFNENKIDDAHSKWEIIWQKGSAYQKKI